jgi:uncharacterized protein (TIGR01777 family)
VQIVRILITGSTGLIGSTLVGRWAGVHEVVRLARRAPDPSRSVSPNLLSIVWDPASGAPPPPELEGFDVVVHLAGESIAGGLWTKEKKRRIRESRVHGTRGLAEALARLKRKPRVLVCASAVGWYGDRGDAILDETTAPGTGFLAQACRDWESAAHPAREAGIRVVWTRFGIVVSKRGGALAAMLPAFRLGLGGPLGSGHQFMSWVALDDLAGAVDHAIADERLAGPVNVTSPEPVTNEEWTRTLGRVLGRPTFLRVPAFALRLLPGNMADEALLASARVVPRRLQETGYGFRWAGLEGVLRREVGRSRSPGLSDSGGDCRDVP